MDDVVRQIYKAIEDEPHLQETLLILTGDHGMNEKGNHGGDSPSETASAMTFISPRLKSISEGMKSPVPATNNYQYYSVINQIDIVPTLAGLLGFSIPVSSVGIFISRFLDLLPSLDAKLQLLLKNAGRMMNVFEMKYEAMSSDTNSCSSHCGECSSEESRVVCQWGKVKRAEQDWKRSRNDSSEDLMCTISDVSLPKPGLSKMEHYMPSKC